MHSVVELIRGIALVAFAIGGLRVAVGQTKRGYRCIFVAVALIVVEPLLVDGLVRLDQTARGHSAELGQVILALFIAAIVIAGLVALRRTRRERRSAEGTSQKRRVENMP